MKKIGKAEEKRGKEEERQRESVIKKSYKRN